MPASPCSIDRFRPSAKLPKRGARGEARCGKGAGKRYAIRVNAILSGVVETDMIRGVIDRSPDPAAALAAFEGMAPMKRMAQLDQVSPPVAFLAFDEAAFISGSDYVIDDATTAAMMGA